MDGEHGRDAALLVALVPLDVIALPVEEVLERLADGRVDVGIVRRDEIGPRLESKPIGTIDHALFVPKALVPRDARDEDLLFRLPLALQVSEPDFLVRLRELAARRRRTLNVALECGCVRRCARSSSDSSSRSRTETFGRRAIV